MLISNIIVTYVSGHSQDKMNYLDLVSFLRELVKGRVTIAQVLEITY
jgi:hypothetical protein